MAIKYRATWTEAVSGDTGYVDGDKGKGPLRDTRGEAGRDLPKGRPIFDADVEEVPEPEADTAG